MPIYEPMEGVPKLDGFTLDVYLICVVSDWRGCIFHMEIEFLNSDYKEECYVYSSFRQFVQRLLTGEW